jgi:deoxyribonuclease-4
LGRYKEIFYQRNRAASREIFLMKIGAHVSIAGGFDQAQRRIKEMGGNCLQIFSSSPRGWSLPDPKVNFRFDLSPVYFHASYLINLADKGEIGRKSGQSLIAQLNLAPRLGVKGSVVHLGSGLLDEVLFNNLNEVLKKTPPETLFIIENSGTRKIGRTMEEIKKILDRLDNPRVRVCLDTCHLFAAGIRFEEMEKLPFLDRVELIHLNDSRDPFGSGRDRHENIGQGQIGLENFRMIVNHPKLKHLPFILEVPGFADRGPDEQNIQIIKKLKR